MKGFGRLLQRIRTRLEGLTGDPSMHEVTRGTMLALLLQIGGSSITFAFHVAVARLVGVPGAGVFFLALSVSSIGSIIGRIGLDNTLLRFVATRSSGQDWAGVKGVYSSGMRLAAATSVVVTVVFVLASDWMAYALFHKPELAGPLRWMNLSILPFTLLNLQAECLKGVKQVQKAMLVQGSGVPLISLLLIVPLSRANGVVGVSFSYLISTVAVATLGIWVWQRALNYNEVAAVPVRVRDLWESCRPLYGVSLLSRAALPWAPLFLLGLWASNDEVGVFGAATRISIMVSIILIPASNVVAPKFAALYANKEMGTLERTARRSATLSTLIALPLLFVLIVGAQQLMGLFGPGFEKGGPVLMILALGQFVNAYTGSIGFVLMMGGREGAAWKALLYSAVASLGLCILLIPLWGAVGCAVAVTLAEVLKNVLMVKFCKDEFGILPIPLLWTRTK